MTAEGALLAAWETGIRYFDTAPSYGSGLSEHRFGHVLRRFNRDLKQAGLLPEHAPTPGS